MEPWNLDTSDKVEFIKFPEGKTVIRVLDTAPHIRWTHWIPTISKSVNCPGIENGCPICEIRKQQKENKQPYTYGASRKFSFNILTRPDNRLKILDASKTFVEDLNYLRTKLTKGVNMFDVSVVRRGQGTDTQYRLDEENVSDLTPEETSVQKVDLNEYFKPQTTEQIQRLVDGESWESVFQSASEEDVLELE